MNKKDFNVVDNNDNQELAKGIAFLKSRRAVANLSLMLDEMNKQTMPNGVDIRFAYCDCSRTADYDRDDLDGFFEMLAEHDIDVVVVRSLNGPVSRFSTK